ncbi:glycosyltransferase [uncultured Fibrobacter sp.]|uniref:glycosyltransferase n=1 Tax=uncultured Fibrobacter sp. TaxID=261512 RepID=UPI002803E833|nr:glycosyltransferase [uncultured Fibrobacter sp.]
MISIAMATYNGSKYVQLQLDSILQQTISDFEIIICDDNSSDETWNIIRENADRDSRIKVFRNERNLGFKANFEKAMSLCRGEYVALADQDDIWEKDHLEVLLNSIGNSSIACGDARLIDSEGNSLNKNLSDINFLETEPRANLDVAYRVFFNSSCFQGASMLIHRDFLNIALPIPEKAKYHDAWFAGLAPFVNGLIYTKTIVTQHRRHTGNASSHLHWKSLGPIFYRRAPHLPDRPFWGEAIQVRIPNLSPAQQKFLKSVKRYYTRRLAKTRKAKNFFFRLLHYAAIYTTKSKIYLEW